MTHTPGPWMVESDARSVMVVAELGGMQAMAVIVSEGGTPRPTDHANARLIAAAPDLLATFREFYGAIAMNGFVPVGLMNRAHLLLYASGLSASEGSDP